MVVWRGQNNANLPKILLNRYKFTKRSEIVSKRLEYYLARMNTHYKQKPDHFSLNCFARSKFCQICFGFGDSIPYINKPRRHHQVGQLFWLLSISQPFRQISNQGPYLRMMITCIHDHVVLFTRYFY